jgi:hypothetical protein
MRATAAGLGLYAFLVLVLHAIPGAAIPLSALKAVAPGFAAGWVRRGRGLGYGALIGAAGGLLEVALVMLADLPFGVPEQLIVASHYAVAGSALTNALGGAAGESLAARGAARTPR